MLGQLTPADVAVLFSAAIGSPAQQLVISNLPRGAVVRVTTVSNRYLFEVDDPTSGRCHVFRLRQKPKSPKHGHLGMLRISPVLAVGSVISLGVRGARTSLVSSIEVLSRAQQAAAA